ncbi:hypothetical protein [Kitasatospora viridis]|uniref:hypothetical protein n=1 Tax=Kitasatospora viridis TaxID=281105 RepID=UPI00119F0173|nr:hypothetical protein [Kitasatospora viridis]
MIANAAGALLSMASCVAGLVNPGIGLPEGEPVTGGVRFYAEAYGARALPLGAMVLQQLVRGRGGRVLPAVLLLAGAVQAGDAAIGVRTRNPGMALGAGALAVLHLETARRFARSAR